MVVENQGDGMFLRINANLILAGRVNYDSVLFRHSDACVVKRRIIFILRGRCFILCYSPITSEIMEFLSIIYIVPSIMDILVFL